MIFLKIVAFMMIVGFVVILIIGRSKAEEKINEQCSDSESDFQKADNLYNTVNQIFCSAKCPCDASNSYFLCLIN